MRIPSMASTAYFNAPSRAATFSPNMSSEPGFQPAPLERNFSQLGMHDVRPNDSIMNTKGGLASSLYQNCLNLRKRLAFVPGFDVWLNEMDQEEQYTEDDTDPVTLLWNTLRRGEPLVAIYNALQPAKPIQLNTSKISQANAGKAATFKFLQACLEDLKFPANECFLITDLYGSDTTGFVKVLKVISRVLDVMQNRGLMLENNEQTTAGGESETRALSHRDNVIRELVTTERDYVNHLEQLQQFKNSIDQTGSVPGDIVHGIFLNLNALLDFQRRFLIRIEQQNSLDSELQNWGLIFAQYHESFKVYEPFIANTDRCNSIVVKEWDKLHGLPTSGDFSGINETAAVLLGFLLKPFQRLSKYPLLLDDLRKKGDYDDDRKEDLRRGSEAMRAVLDSANLAVEQVKMEEEVQELINLVDDWKGHKIESFGDLVLCGTYPVLKGEGSKETEREYKIYLFQRILLCCKEINPKKEKNRLAGKSSVDRRGKPKLQLKGRIFISNVTDMISKPKEDHHLLQIWWKGDPGIETFVIKFKLMAEKEKWSIMIQDLRTQLREFRALNSAGVSQTEFTSMTELVKAQMINPYIQQDDEEFDSENARHSQATTLNGSATSYSEHTASRNASNGSLRSRSTTGGSGGLSRIAPARFPIPEPQMGLGGMPLKVQTSIDDPDSDDRYGSHFSPTGDSPNSMRSSSQAGMYPFPRQHTPSSGWPSQEPLGNKHNTAPPMGRNPLREDENVNGYGPNSRSARGPSLPAMIPSQSAQAVTLAQQRARSLSSPDVHNGLSPGRRLPNGQSTSSEDVPVPSIPAHLAGSMRPPINRSQNSSPTDSIRGPRTNTQSPNMMRPPNNYAYDSYGPQRSNSGFSNQVTGAGRILSPPMSASAVQSETPISVSQLKVKIHFEPKPSHVTIVVPVIIKHRSLIDRIDSKMEKVSSASIAKGTARLRYKDSEGELVLIENDDDVLMAIEDWQDGNSHQLKSNIIPDFDLFWKENHAGYSRTPM